jgi:hypothetical protein
MSLQELHHKKGIPVRLALEQFGEWPRGVEVAA